jgi:hypothetical protein
MIPHPQILPPPALLNYDAAGQREDEDHKCHGRRDEPHVISLFLDGGLSIDGGQSPVG